MADLDNVSAEDLLAELLRRAKEGEIDLTAELWGAAKKRKRAKRKVEKARD